MSLPASLIKVCESILTEEVDSRYAFHGLEHTRQVAQEAARLAREEDLTPEEVLLVETAALLHDTGYRDRVSGHEQKSVELARELLPFHGYTLPQIDRITDLVLATTRGHKPKEKLEEVLQDANAAWAGLPSPQAQEWLEKLYAEQRVTGQVSDLVQFLKTLVSWLSALQYHTESARSRFQSNRDRLLWSLERRMMELR